MEARKTFNSMRKLSITSPANVVTLNDIRGRYECYTDVGPSFQSMKEQNRAEIQELQPKVPQGTQSSRC